MAKSAYSDHVVAAFADNAHFERIWVGKNGTAWWTVPRPGTTEVLRKEVATEVKALKDARGAKQDTE
jgi:hypothetical protein